LCKESHDTKSIRKSSSFLCSLLQHKFWRDSNNYNITSSIATNHGLPVVCTAARGYKIPCKMERQANTKTFSYYLSQLFLQYIKLESELGFLKSFANEAASSFFTQSWPWVNDSFISKPGVLYAREAVHCKDRCISQLCSNFICLVFFVDAGWISLVSLSSSYLVTVFPNDHQTFF